MITSPFPLSTNQTCSRVGLLAAAIIFGAAPIFSQTTTPSVQVYVGYAENERIPIYFPDPWVGSPNTIALGTYPGYAWDAGAVLLYNNGTAPVTLSKGVKVSGFASGVTFQLWDSYLPVTIQPGWRVIITQNAALDGPSLSSPYGAGSCIANDNGGTLCFSNFDTSDTPTGSAPSTATPVIQLTLNGVAYKFTDTAQVLNTGGFDYGTEVLLNESQQWRPVGTTGPDLPAGTGVPPPPVSAFDVTTHHYNDQRTGVNTQESTLTPAAVGSSAFTKLNTVNFNGHVDAQALVISASTWSSWGYASTYTHDVVYIATSNNDIFAIDGATGAVLKQRNFGTPVPRSSLPLSCGNNGSTVGITSTPVIDPTNKVMYFISYNLVSNAPVYFVHKINLLDLSDNVAATPVSAVSTLSDGKTQVTLVAAYQRQRPGLLLSGGNLYAAFGSFCDLDSNISRGWIVGWTAASLSPLPSAALMDSATNAQVGGGLSGVAGGYTIDFNSSIWQSGFALSADSAGNVYAQTGNSDGSTVANFPDSVVKVSSTLASVEDYFTPLNFKALDLQDMERGSSGVMVVPDQANGNKFAVAHGKDGRLFLLNRNNLGRLSTTNEDVPPFVTTGGCWCGPDYFVGADNNPRIVSNGGVNVQTWFLPSSVSGNLTLEATGVSMPSYGNWDPGFQSSVSMNGTQPNSAVIWSVSRAQNGRIFLQALDGTAGAGSTGSAQPGGGAVVDKAGNIWSFGAATRTPGEHSVVLNGSVIPGAYAVKLVIGNDGKAYQLNAYNQWYVQSGSTFTQLSAAPKARPVSLTGTTITPATGGALTDSSGNVWTFGPNVRNAGEYSVLVNGVPTIAFALKVVIDTNGVAWHYNYYGQWFTGDGVNWTEQSGPPSLLLKSWIGDTISAGSGGSLTDSAGNVWSFGTVSRNPGENNVMLNGKSLNGAFAVRLFIGTNGDVWQFNYYGQWWTGNGTNWTMASSTPNFFTPRVGSWATPAAAGELRELQLVDTGAWTVTSNANVVPVVANGRVYVPSDNALTIWGIE